MENPKLSLSPLIGLYVAPLETHWWFGGVLDVFSVGAPLLSYMELR